MTDTKCSISSRHDKKIVRNWFLSGWQRRLLHTINKGNLNKFGRLLQFHEQTISNGTSFEKSKQNIWTMCLFYIWKILICYFVRNIELHCVEGMVSENLSEKVSTFFSFSSSLLNVWEEFEHEIQFEWEEEKRT